MFLIMFIIVLQDRTLPHYLTGGVCILTDSVVWKNMLTRVELAVETYCIIFVFLRNHKAWYSHI